MTALSRRLIRIAVIVTLVGCSTPAFADTKVRVRRDRITVWTADFKSRINVNAGTTLHVVGERNDWYEVILPGHFRGETGFVHKTAVDPDDGTTPAPLP